MDWDWIGYQVFLHSQQQPLVNLTLTLTLTLAADCDDQRQTGADRHNQRQTRQSSPRRVFLHSQQQQQPVISIQAVGATICPRPSPPSVGAEAPRAAEHTAT